MPTHVKTLVDHDFLGQWNFVMRPDGSSGQATLEIAKVERFVPPRQKAGEKNKKVEISFAGQAKPWICGPVSQKVIIGMYGPYIEDWIGKKITLYVDAAVMFGADRVGGIRVRPTIPKGPRTERALDEPADPERQAIIDEAKAKAGNE
jgi:hypothetical protein